MNNPEFNEIVLQKFWLMQFLQGQILSDEIIRKAGELACKDANPIDVVRSSLAYRSEMVRVCVKRLLQDIRSQDERANYPSNPVLLGGPDNNPQGLDSNLLHVRGTPIVTMINGKSYTLPGNMHKTLLRLLREDAGLIGTKEGCAEGECGACTVSIDGKLVNSCLVLAVDADGKDIVTMEKSTTGALLMEVPIP